MTKADNNNFVEAGRETRFGVDWPGRRCLAKTRRSSLCQKAALKGREARLTDGFPVTRLVLFEQAVAHQKPDAALANFDRRNHDNTP